MRETAYAKINLALHVRRRREDGYHEIETLFAFVNAGDRLKSRTAERGHTIGLQQILSECPSVQVSIAQKSIIRLCFTSSRILLDTNHA